MRIAEESAQPEVYGRLGVSGGIPLMYLECTSCDKVFDFDVGKINFELVNARPQFEHEIVCPSCGKLTLDEVELTELGQSQLTELWWIDGERKQRKKQWGFRGETPDYVQVLEFEKFQYNIKPLIIDPLSLFQRERDRACPERSEGVRVGVLKGNIPLDDVLSGLTPVPFLDCN